MFFLIILGCSTDMALTGDGGAYGSSASSVGVGIEAGTLTAGEWRDLDNWEFWRGLFEPVSPDSGDSGDSGSAADSGGAADSGSSTDTGGAARDYSDMEALWGFYTAGRVPVVVADGGGPVVDAAVSLVGPDGVEWQARTNVEGEAELFAGLYTGDTTGPWSVEVSADGETARVDGVTPGGEVVPVALSASSPQTGLDLLFLIDTTGSMGDELAWLQVELGDVIARVQEEVGEGLDLRVSVNFYRDEGDEYVVRSFPFTRVSGEALMQLSVQSSGGGGDTPEAMAEAWDDAVNGHEWRESARSRLAIAVLDAPPHDGADVKASVRATTKEAAAKGIRLVPLAASGVDRNTEFLLRFADIATGGTYTFLTDDSGIGGDHLEPTIGEFEVEPLNDLLVRVIVASVRGG